MDTPQGPTTKSPVKDFSISEEVAGKQLQEFIDYYDIVIEDITDDPKLGLMSDSSCRKLVRCIRQGRLELNADGTAVLHFRDDSTVICRELDTTAKMEMGKRSEADYNGRLYAMMGSLTGIGIAGLRVKVKGPDLAMLESLGVLFMLV